MMMAGGRQQGGIGDGRRASGAGGGGHGWRWRQQVGRLSVMRVKSWRGSGTGGHAYVVIWLTYDGPDPAVVS
jgi:hypothetical protein